MALPCTRVTGGLACEMSMQFCAALLLQLQLLLLLLLLLAAALVAKLFDDDRNFDVTLFIVFSLFSIFVSVIDCVKNNTNVSTT